MFVPLYPTTCPGHLISGEYGTSRQRYLTIFCYLTPVFHRFVLNYKRLPYRTQWVEFPDVENILRSQNAPPTSVRPDGRPLYTLPVIIDARTNVILSNANTIADYLEITYPARPVFPEGSRALQCLFVHYIQEVFAKPLLPIMVPMSHLRLPERSQAHFFASQRQQPSQLSPPQREQAWAAVKEQFDFLASLLDKNNGPDGDGIVAMGHEVSYADFALCSVLIWIETISPHDGWARVRQWNGGRWLGLRNKCSQYMDAY
jgi:glutathione S-transferase